MQVTIDIPEPLYREVEAEAAATAQGVEAVVVRRIHDAPSPLPPRVEKTGRVKLPILESGRHGSFDPGDRSIYEFIEFP